MASTFLSPNTGTSSISYFAFVEATNCRTEEEEEEKKDNDIFQVTVSPFKSIYNPLKLHFSMNDKCNYLSLAIKTYPY